jgi:hypothetical protein
VKVGKVHLATAIVVAGCGPAPAVSDPYVGPDGGGTRGALLSSAGGSATDDSGNALGPGDGAAPNGSDQDGSSSGGDGSSGPVEGGTCATGQVTPDQVVMLGDSYLDPAWSNAALDLFADARDAGSLAASATYRHYYIGGASMAWGNPNTQFYIPYQYDPMAKTDWSVMSPTDIKVVIMDGGGNDVLIGNSSCEQTAPPANTSCVTTIQNAIDKARSEMQLMASDGVKSIVFFFYPHLDPAGGGILTTPAPAVNDTLDYAYPLAEQVCCGTTFTSSASRYTCAGEPVAGTKCVFVDTRPAFEGHTADYIKSDHVHPTPAGAQVLADLLWNAMKDHCVAQ